MTFDEALEKVRELLQRQGRVSYSALKLRFSLDEVYLEAIKAELIDAQRLAVDEDGKVLVWVGTDAEGEGGNAEREGEGAKRRKGFETPTPNPELSNPQLPTRLRTSLNASVQKADRWRAQNHHGVVCRSQRLDGVN